MKWIVGAVEGPWIHAPTRSPVGTLCHQENNELKNHFFQHGVFFCLFPVRTSPSAWIRLWTLSPRWSVVFPTMSPRSFFPPGPRFSPSNHVTSGSLHLRYYFPPGQRFPTPLPVSVTSLPLTSGHMTSGWAHPPYGLQFFTSLTTTLATPTTNHKPEQGVCMQITVGKFS